MPLFSHVLTNCSLVTELQIQCFNSLVCRRAPDLFNQYSKYVCNSLHAQSRSSSWGFVFYWFSTYCYLEVGEYPTFFSSTATKWKRDESSSSTGQLLLNASDMMSARGELAGTCRSAPSPPWVPRSSTGVQGPCWSGRSWGEFIAHSDLSIPDAELRLELRAKSGPLGVEISSSGIPWAEGVLGWQQGAAWGGGWCWGWELPAHVLCGYLKGSKRAQRLSCLPAAHTSCETAAQSPGQSPLPFYS